ncbi:MAG: hypothetical protein FWE31_05800 [Firmicutes bacterium]|nr:hypothetical protein [Bacillota bacterium]
MMDKQTRKLLDILAKNCGDNGEYKILEITEIIEAFPKKSRPTIGFISTTTKFLSDLEMIDIRHSDESHLAVSILPKGRIYKEERQLAADAKKWQKGLLGLIIFGSFLAAFVASLLAGVVVSSIM